MREVRNILCVSCGYVAAVIGAGFASGQEIVSFFVKYGKFSIIGVLFACIIFSLFSYAILSICVELKIKSYSEYINIFFKPNMKKIIEIATVFFAMSSVCVMTACAGEMVFALFGIKRIVGAAFFITVCGVIFFMGSKKVMSINSILGAIIVFGIILSCLFILRFREHQVFVNTVSMAASSVSYAGYNLLTAGVILAGMSRFLADKREALLSSVTSGVVLFILMGLIWGVLGMYYGKINLGEIPMLTMMLRQNNVIGGFYGVMLFLAVLTTGLSNGFGVMDIVSDKIGRTTTIFFVLALGLCFSGAGFSMLINTAYRACGYVGILLVLYVIYIFIKKDK